MAGQNRNGPYRFVRDNELRDIFFLTPQTGTAFFLTVHTGSFAGAERPEVTPILREMLYLLTMTPAELATLRKRIQGDLASRDLIPIRAKLLSLCQRVFEDPEHFPALLDTSRCKPYIT